MAPFARHSRRWWATALILTAAVVCAACVALQSHRRATPEARAAASVAPTTAPTTASTGALLTVIVKDMRNRNGDLILGVFTQADGFPNVQSKSVYWEVKPADADAVTFTTRLPPGRYAVGVLHDENRSGDMDKGLAGIPLEGYGVTNNPKPKLRKATFDEATFTLPPEGAQVTISLQYF